jgi:hypothetical protein
MVIDIAQSKPFVLTMSAFIVCSEGRFSASSAIGGEGLFWHATKARIKRIMMNTDFDLSLIYFFLIILQGNAQRFALPACGRAWTMFGSRKNSKREKCLKMPQNPTRQVHALLGVFELCKTR